MNRLAMIAITVFMVSMFACSEDADKPEFGFIDIQIADTVWHPDVTVDESSKEDVPDVPLEPFPEDFVVSFVYKGIVPNENTDQSDLYVVTSKGRNPFNKGVKTPVALTSFAINPDDCQLVMEKKMDGTPLTTAPCSCNLGCVVDRTLSWILVTVEKPSATGFAFQIGKFNADLQVQMVKGKKFVNIVDVDFAGGYLYFSQVKYCTEVACQFIVFRYDLGNIAEPESLFLLPPDDDPDYKSGQTITDGHFTVSHDGSTLALLSPTIRSTRLYVWRAGELVELDYLCPGGMQGDHCTGSGSQFSDVDPLAVSNNGKHIAFFPTSNDGLELRYYNAESGIMDLLPLMVTTDKDFNVESCLQIDGSSWLFNTVASPLFAHDDSGVLFIASSNCNHGKRPFTDIVELPVSTVNSGIFKEHAFKNITLNPRNDDVDNTIIEAFDLSPDGGNVSYSASPMYKDNGDPLSPQSANALHSRELWVVSRDGLQKMQITYNSKYSVTWLRNIASEYVSQ
jgi:hypothetical protein